MVKELIIENAEFFYRNFSGMPTALNPDGDYKVGVRIDGRRAKKLRSEGWNVKVAKNNKGKNLWMLPVRIELHDDGALSKAKLTTIGRILIQGNSESYPITEFNAGFLDYAEIKSAKVRILGWEYKRRDGTKTLVAYLRDCDVIVSNKISASRFYSLYNGRKARIAQLGK